MMLDSPREECRRPSDLTVPKACSEVMTFPEPRIHFAYLLASTESRLTRYAGWAYIGN
jgi:hypothetical protein